MLVDDEEEVVIEEDDRQLVRKMVRVVERQILTLVGLAVRSDLDSKSKKLIGNVHILNNHSSIR